VRPFLAEPTADLSDRVAVLSTEGKALRAQGKTADAESVYREALTQGGGASPGAIANVKYNFARMCLDLGRIKEAETLAGESLRLREGSTSASAADVGESENLVGLIDYAAGRPDEAIAMFQRALTRSGNSFAAAESLINLGMVYRRSGDLAKAKSSLLKALELSRGFPERAELLATALNDLGLVARDAGNRREAEEHLREAVAVWKTQSGIERLGYSGTLSNLGVLEEDRHHYAEARSLYEQALGLDRVIFGSTSPTVGLDLIRIGALLARTGDETRGRAFLDQALEGAAQSKEPSTVTGLAHGQLGLLAMRQKDWQNGEKLLRSAVTELEQVAGPNDRQRATFLAAYAQVLKHNGRYAESEEMSTELARIEYRPLLNHK
jgi:tetratricopeptide (TPR) repeat protein